MTDVRLVDLDVFKRYSLAIRQETAPAEEVLELLDATRRQVVAVAGGDGQRSGPAAPPVDLAAPEPDADWAPDPEAWAAAAEGPAAEAAEPVEEPPPAAQRAVRRRVRRTADPPDAG